MLTTYNQISREVGYIGHTPFPSMEKMDELLRSLSLNPTISNFKKALSLYRFAPEAKTVEEERMVYMLQLGLSIAQKDLFVVEDRRPFAEVAVNYLLNLIPSLTLFYLFRITLISTEQLFQI